MHESDAAVRLPTDVLAHSAQPGLDPAEASGEISGGSFPPIRLGIRCQTNPGAEPVRSLVFE